MGERLVEERERVWGGEGRAEEKEVEGSGRLRRADDRPAQLQRGASVAHRCCRL